LRPKFHKKPRIISVIDLHLLQPSVLELRDIVHLLIQRWSRQTRWCRLMSYFQDRCRLMSYFQDRCRLMSYFQDNRLELYGPYNQDNRLELYGPYNQFIFQFLYVFIKLIYLIMLHRSKKYHMLDYAHV
jgi:hypothetical protein